MLKLGDVAEGTATDRTKPFESYAHCANCWYTHRRPKVGLQGEKEIRDILEKVDHEKDMTVLNKFFEKLSSIVLEFGSEKRKVKKGKKVGTRRSKKKLTISKNLLSMVPALKARYKTFDLPTDRDKMTKWIREVSMASNINLVDSDPKVNQCNTSTVWSLLKQCSSETTHNAINTFESWFKSSFTVPASSLVGLAAIFTAMKLASVSLEMTEVTNAYSKFRLVTQQATETLKAYLTRYDEVITTLEGTIKAKLNSELTAQFFYLSLHRGLQDEFRHDYHSRNYGRKFTMPEIRKLVSAMPDKRPSSKDKGADLKARNAVNTIAKDVDKLTAMMKTVKKSPAGKSVSFEDLDEVNAFNGASRRPIVCCKCGGNHPWSKCPAINGMIRYNKSLKEYEWCNVGLRSDTPEGKAIAAKGGLKTAYMFNEGKTGQYWQRENFHTTAEGKRIIDNVAYLMASKEERLSMDEPELDGEVLTATQRASMMNALGYKSETIPNNSLYDSSPSPKKRKRKGKNAGSSLSATSEPKKQNKSSTLQNRIRDLFAVVGNDGMVVSDTGKLARDATIKELQDSASDNHATEVTQLPLSTWPTTDGAALQTSTRPSKYFEEYFKIPARQHLLWLPCSQGQTLANVPETLTDPECTDSIGDDVVLDTIKPPPLPNPEEIDLLLPDSCPAILRERKVQLAMQIWWYGACNGNALQAVLQASFDADGSPRPSPFCQVPLAVHEVADLFEEADRLQATMSSTNGLGDGLIAPGYIHNKSLLMWMGMNPFDCTNHLDPDNMPHDSHQVPRKPWSEPCRSMGEFVTQSNASPHVHADVDQDARRLHSFLTNHKPVGYRDAVCHLHPDAIDDNCRICDQRKCPLHNQHDCEICPLTVHKACRTLGAQDLDHYLKWLELAVYRSQLLQSASYDPTLPIGHVDLAQGTFGPIHPDRIAPHWHPDNPPMLNGHVGNIANFLPGGDSVGLSRDNPGKRIGTLLNAYTKRNGSVAQCPRWPVHPMAGGEQAHVFNIAECQQRILARSQDDWRTSGLFLVDTSKVAIDVIPDPCCELRPPPPQERPTGAAMIPIPTDAIPVPPLPPGAPFEFGSDYDYDSEEMLDDDGNFRGCSTSNIAPASGTVPHGESNAGPPSRPSPPSSPCPAMSKRHKGNNGAHVPAADDHCTLMRDHSPKVGGVAQVAYLNTRLSPQQAHQSQLPGGVDNVHQSAIPNLSERLYNVFGPPADTDRPPPVDPLGAFLEADKMVIAASGDGDDPTGDPSSTSFSTCEPSIGLNGASHRSLTMLAELKKPLSKGTYLAYQETLDTGAGLDYMVLDVAEALCKFCPNIVTKKERYKVPLTTIAADEGQMQRVGYIKVKVIMRNNKGQDIEVQRRYEILTKCILIAIRGMQGQSQDRGFLDVHSQDSSATMTPETYTVRDPMTNIFPLVRANNHLEPSF